MSLARCSDCEAVFDCKDGNYHWLEFGDMKRTVKELCLCSPCYWNRTEELEMKEDQANEQI